MHALKRRSHEFNRYATVCEPREFCFPKSHSASRSRRVSALFACDRVLVKSTASTSDRERRRSRNVARTTWGCGVNYSRQQLSLSLFRIFNEIIYLNMEDEISSFKLTNKHNKKTEKSSYIWMELKLLQLFVIQCRLGQIVLKVLERFLWIVEKCAEWSLPDEEIPRDENGKILEKLELVRPLPWILFLPSLIILRIIKISLNIIIFLLGFSLITANDLVKFTQKLRMHLIALKCSEMETRHYKDKRSSMNEAKQALIKSIRLTLSSLSCLDASKPSLSPPPTKIHVSSALDLDAVTTTLEENSVTESMDSIKRRGSINSAEQDKEKQKTRQEELNQSTDSSDSEYVCSVDRDNSSINSDSNTSVSSNELNDLIQDIQKWHEEERKADQNQQFMDAERASTNVEQAATNVEQAATNAEKATMDAEQATVDVEQATVDAEQATVDVEQAAVDVEQAASDTEQAATDTEQTVADAEQATPEQKSSAKESRDKVEERYSSSRRIDSSEYHTSDRSSQEGDLIFYSPISSDSDTPKECSKSSAPIAEKPVSGDSLKTAEFINGEICFSSASTVSELKSLEKANNGAVVDKRGANASKCHKGKRTSHSNRRKK
ncbi:protein P54 isoform X2 [Linepithema humile]|uniref:protein P54 isoform X2 n=1 Tax=Linepithema humile TaxID=83485 RepID=UPI0006236D55|nr:PREDICTED: dentin sialophosphoprotein-like isoform X2 [Linepithema humile]